MTYPDNADAKSSRGFPTRNSGSRCACPIRWERCFQAGHRPNRDPKAGWKGRGLWSNTAMYAPWHIEGGKGTARQGHQVPSATGSARQVELQAYTSQLYVVSGFSRPVGGPLKATLRTNARLTQAAIRVAADRRHGCCCHLRLSRVLLPLGEIG